MPDAPLASNDGGATMLFDQIHNSDDRSWGWRLLLLDGVDRANPTLAAAADASRGSTADLPALVEHVATVAAPAL